MSNMVKFSKNAISFQLILQVDEVASLCTSLPVAGSSGLLEVLK